MGSFSVLFSIALSLINIHEIIIIYSYFFQFTNGQSRSPPRRQHYLFNKNHSTSPLNTSIIQERTSLHSTLEGNFLVDVITSINHQQKQNSSPLEMRKGPQKKIHVEPKVLFKSHHPQNHNKEGEESRCSGEEVEDSAEAHVIFHKEGDTDGKFAGQDVPKPKMSTQAATASTSSVSEHTTSGKKQGSSMSTAFRQKFRSLRPQVRSLFCVRPSRRTEVQGTAQRHEHLWAHSCDSEKLEEKASMGECQKEPLSVKSETADKLKFKCVKCGHGQHSGGNGEASKSHVKTSSNNRSVRADNNSTNNTCSDSLDHILGESKSQSRRKSERKSSKPSDQEAPDSCLHKVPSANDIVAIASKTEVYCIKCGITLPKPQCFYSLGSLVIDGEICETDSDDINRHPVGDIDDDRPLVEVQSHHDTGYTSSEDFENESNLSKEPGPSWVHDKQETDSYDGDYESDNEETGVKRDKLSDDMALKPLASVGEPVAITDYALQEWKSDTPTSTAMKKVNTVLRVLSEKGF